MAQIRTYRPSAFLRIQIRLEDFSQDGDVAIPSESHPPEKKADLARAQIANLRGQLGEAKIALLKGGSDNATVVDLERQIKVQENIISSENNNVQAADQAQGKKGPYDIDIFTVPIELEVNINGLNTADNLSATIPFMDAPIYSQLVRSALVECWAGTIKIEDFASPSEWRLKRNDPATTLLFRGYIDDWKTVHSDDNAKVEIKARALEAILMDAKINPLANVYRIKSQQGELISTYINRILRQFPPTSGNTGGDAMQSLWYGADPDAEPILTNKMLLRTLQTASSRNQNTTADSSGNHITADNPDDQTAPGDRLGLNPGTANVPPSKGSTEEMSVWELIYQACRLAGCIPRYDPSLPPVDGINPGDYILLCPPQTIFQDVTGDITIKAGAVDGFSRSLYSGGVGDGPIVKNQSDIRFMVWGHNIKNFETNRHLGRQKILAVNVISYNSEAGPGGRNISVTFPPQYAQTYSKDQYKAINNASKGLNKKTRASKVGSSGDTKSNEIQTINVYGIRDKTQLEQIAVGLYHQMRRQELSVTLETHDLSSYIDPTSGLEYNKNPDLLKLRPGSPCKVTVARTLKTMDTALALTPLSEVFELRAEELTKLFKSQHERYNPRTFLAQSDNVAGIDQMVSKIMTAWNTSKLTDVFYCRGINHKFNSSDGWTGTIDLVNYLDVVADPVKLSVDAAKQNDKAKVKVAKTTKSPQEKNKEITDLAEERLNQANQIKRF